MPVGVVAAADGLDYNTLLEGAPGSGVGGVTFGEHLMKKWAGVQTTAPPKPDQTVL
jgi:hypothetical protein